MKEIHLTQGKVTLVDDEDFEWLSEFKWCAEHHHNDVWYARGTLPKSEGKSRAVRMHRMIMGVTDRKIQVDHDNHNGLDNRRENLRIADQRLNNGNQRKRITSSTSQFKGVYWSKNAKKWNARIGIYGKTTHIGYFVSEIDAAIAYNLAAIEQFGEYSHLNEIPSTDQ